MQDKLYIRPAKPGDAERVQELRKLGWQDNYVNEESGVTSELLKNKLAVLPPAKSDIDFYLAMLSNDQNHNLVAEIDGVVVGTVTYDTLKDGTGDIGVFVDREMRGQGIGSKILSVLLESTSAKLQVIIFAKNNSRNLYKKYGFVESGTEQRHYFSKDVYLPVQTLVLTRTS